MRNVIMLDRRCAVPGHGWGCFVCGEPPDGASVVLCDRCFETYRQDPLVLTVACRAYPATDGRIPIAELPLEALCTTQANTRGREGNDL